MSIKQKLINYEISYHEARTGRYNDLTQEYVDFIVEKEPWVAAYYLSHKLSEENMSYLANNHPKLLKYLFS